MKKLLSCLTALLILAGCLALPASAKPWVKAALSKNEYTYNGKERTPTVTAKDSNGNRLKEGRDFTVKLPKGRIKAGSYTVTVKFKGLYDRFEAQKLTYKIRPPKTAIKTILPGKGEAGLRWTKKTEEVTGYRIYYSRDRDFEDFDYVTVKSTEKCVKKLTGLSEGAVYYLKIKTYKEKDGKKLFSLPGDTVKIRTASTGSVYTVNMTGKTFHRRGCSAAAKAASNCITVNTTRNILSDRGFKSCGRCMN